MLLIIILEHFFYRQGQGYSSFFQNGPIFGKKRALALPPSVNFRTIYTDF